MTYRKSIGSILLLGFILLSVAFSHFALGQDRQQMQKRIIKRFPQADLDGDGKLSAAEFDALSKKMLRKYPEADTDSDGKLSAQERQALMRKMMARNKNKPTPKDSKYSSDKPAPDHANVKYGPHERNVFDLWLAKSDQPTPIAIYIHGGGFTSGSKEKFKAKDLTDLLAAGISVASISYRLVPDVPQSEPFQDGRRALQFIRHKSGEWNIDKTRVAVFGGSAGAQVCMWIAYSDDMAQPNSKDPVERESTRVTCLATAGGQTSMEQDFLEKHMRPILGDKYSLEKALGAGSLEQQNKSQEARWKVPTRKEATAKIKEHSALFLISADDPPIFMSYGMAPDAKVPSETGKLRGWLIHHSFFGVELKKKADSLKVENHLMYRGANCEYQSKTEFFKAKLFPEK